MSNTITARLADMQETLAAYNAIETDIATVTAVLSNISSESSTVWCGDAANAFTTNMEMLMTQVKTIAEHVGASKVALTTSINAYKVLEETNANDIRLSGEEFVTV